MPEPYQCNVKVSGSAVCVQAHLLNVCNNCLGEQSLYLNAGFFGQGLLVSTAWHLLWSNLLWVWSHVVVQISRLCGLPVAKEFPTF